MSITLVIGGCRSGKSTYAEEYVGSKAEDVAYLATAQALDKEMEDRITKHQIRRPESWTTYEEPLNIAEKIGEIKQKHNVILLDCITLFVSNVLLKDVDFENVTKDDLYKREDLIIMEINKVIENMQDDNKELIIVTSEVGLGLVPGDLVSRVYRDIVGHTNQVLADKADEVIAVFAGISIRIKSKNSSVFNG